MSEPNEDHVLTRVMWIDPKTNLRRSQFYETHMGGWRLRAGVLGERGVANTVSHFTDKDLDAIVELRNIPKMMQQCAKPPRPEGTIIFTTQPPVVHDPKPVPNAPPVIFSEVQPRYLPNETPVDLSGLQIPTPKPGPIVFNPRAEVLDKWVLPQDDLKPGQ